MGRNGQETDILSQRGDQGFPKQLTVARSSCTSEASASVRGEYRRAAFTFYRNTENFSLACCSSVMGWHLASTSRAGSDRSEHLMLQET